MNSEEKQSKMKELMDKLDSAEGLIQQNNDNTVVNASKDRLRVKKRRDEIDALEKDFSENIKADPETMDKVSQLSWRELCFSILGS